jgi:uncharacterized membrane protein
MTLKINNSTGFLGREVLPPVKASEASACPRNFDKSPSILYVGGDLTWASRSIQDVIASIPAYCHIFDNCSIPYHGTGITTAMSAFTGPVEATKFYGRIQASAAVGDSGGEKVAWIDFFRAWAQTGGGVGYAAYRPLAIASAMTGVSASGLTAPTLLGRATYGVGLAANLAFGVFYGLIGLSAGVQLYQGCSFSAKLEESTDKMKFLRERLFVNESDVSKMLSKFTKEEFKEEALSFGTKLWTEFFREMENNPEWEGPILNAQQCFEMLKEIIEKKEDAFIQLGVFLKLQKVQAKKEMKLERLLGGEIVQALKDAFNGVSELSAEELLEKVQGALKTNGLINGACLTLGVLGVVATILGIVFTSGAGAIVAAVLFLVVCLLMTGVDLYCLDQMLKAGGMPGPYDTATLLASSILAVVAFAVSVILTAVFLFVVAHAAPAAIALPVVLAFISLLAVLMTNAYAYDKIVQAREKAELEFEENEKKAKREASERDERLQKIAVGILHEQFRLSKKDAIQMLQKEPSLELCLKIHTLEDDLDWKEGELKDLQVESFYSLTGDDRIAIGVYENKFGLSRVDAIKARIKDRPVEKRQPIEEPFYVESAGRPEPIKFDNAIYI